MDDLLRFIIPVVIGNAVTGVIFMVGFVQVVKRSIDKDIPAKLASIDGHMEKLDRHVEKLAGELIEMRRLSDKHEYRIESLERADARHEEETRRRKDDNLNDTGINHRRR